MKNILDTIQNRTILNMADEGFEPVRMQGAINKRRDYISGMVVKTSVTSLTEGKYIIHRKLNKKTY